MSAILLASVMAFTGPIDAMAAGKPGGGGGHPGGGGAHFGGGSRGGGAAHIHAAPSISHSSTRPRSSGNRAASGNRTLAVHSAPSRAVGHRAPLNTGPTATSNSARANHGVHDRAVRNTLNSRSVEGALHNKSELDNPNNRARISAAAATAGWHNGREGGRGWWRHGNGGYGWVGPLYWPFAYVV